MEKDKLQSLTDRCKWRAKVIKPSIPTIGFDDTKIGMLIDGEPHINTRVPHIHCGSFRFPIDVKTLGQYTGYKDKERNEVYEGDILLDENGNMCIVVYRDNTWMLDYMGQMYWYMRDTILEECVVIGNIYDNKDLLK